MLHIPSPVCYSSGELDEFYAMFHSDQNKWVDLIRPFFAFESGLGLDVCFTILDSIIF